MTWYWLTPTEGDAIPEDIMAGRWDEFFSNLCDLREEGLLALGEVRLADPLLHLVRSVCFNAVQALLDGRPFVYQYTDTDADVTFSPDGADIVVTGATEEPVRFRAADLLPALVGCGERFLRFLDLCEDRGWLEHFARIRQEAETTRAALASGLSAK